MEGCGEEGMKGDMNGSDDLDEEEDEKVDVADGENVEENSTSRRAAVAVSSSSSTLQSASAAEGSNVVVGRGHQQQKLEQQQQEGSPGVAVVQQLLIHAAAGSDPAGWGGQYVGEVDGSLYLLWKEVVEVKNTCPFQVRSSFGVRNYIS